MQVGMGVEIERKFLVQGDAWRSLGKGQLYRQGYIPTVDRRTVRVRIVGTEGYLTLKSPVVGLERAEFEYAIPVTDAATLLETLCDPPLIEKIRYRIPLGDLVWEVDEFLGANAGLIVAEVELADANQAITFPDWIGAEVSNDARYFNAALAKRPFTTW